MKRVIVVDDELIHGENIGECYPEAIDAAVRLIQTMEERGGNQHRGGGSMSAGERCPICQDDGWVDVLDPDDGYPVGAMDCPRLAEPGHAPFNATGVLPHGGPEVPDAES